MLEFSFIAKLYRSMEFAL